MVCVGLDCRWLWLVFCLKRKRSSEPCPILQDINFGYSEYSHMENEYEI